MTQTIPDLGTEYVAYLTPDTRYLFIYLFQWWNRPNKDHDQEQEINKNILNAQLSGD